MRDQRKKEKFIQRKKDIVRHFSCWYLRTLHCRWWWRKKLQSCEGTKPWSHESLKERSHKMVKLIYLDIQTTKLDYKIHWECTYYSDGKRVKSFKWFYFNFLFIIIFIISNICWFSKYILNTLYSGGIVNIRNYSKLTDSSSRRASVMVALFW